MNTHIIFFEGKIRQKENEYDKEMPQSQTADLTMPLLERDTEHRQSNKICYAIIII